MGSGQTHSLEHTDNVDLALENASLRAQLTETSLALEAYYDTFGRQQEVLKESLGELKTNIQTLERRRMRESKQIIENLTEENGKLKSTVLKLKERLDGFIDRKRT